jgi:hypothetical protein
MRYIATDPRFLGTLESWLSCVSEILVLIQYSHAPGNKEFEFFSSFDTLANKIRNLPLRTSIVVFRQPQLPVRGIADEGLIASCLSCIPDGSEFLVLETVRRGCGEISCFHWEAGETHAELRDAPEISLGVPVAVGLYPPWLENTNEVASAIMPDENGSVRIGVY